MRRPTLRLATTIAALSPVSLVLAHNLSFLAAYGAGSDAVLRATGHDEGWASAVEAVITITTVLGLLALVRLAALWRTARRVEPASGVRPRTDWRAFTRTVLVVWGSLALLTAAGFLVQENIERIALGQPMPGLEPLLAEGLVGPLIIAAVTLSVALVGGLLLWGIAALRARIAAAFALRLGRRTTTTGMPARADMQRSSILARNLGLRAPPTPHAA